MGILDEWIRANSAQQPTPPQLNPWGGLNVPLVKVVKPKVFISYHHKDQAFIDAFRTQYGAAYEVFTDCSLDEAIESNDLHYVNRTIREDFITGTSITIVICGTDTWKRKCVDWEIYSTLHKDHALLGIALPHVQPVFQNGRQVIIVPNRLHTNIESGYAHWIDYPANAQILKQAIDHALLRSKQNKFYKNNSLAKMVRNK